MNNQLDVLTVSSFAGGMRCNDKYSVLAELMLPDGAHLRPADWTIFFLNQAQPAPWNGNKPLTDNTENPLLYVLNLVRTNHDASIRR
jgi:hypothetical protein